MNFFDKISQTASQTYKYTQEKTNKLAKTAKLKTLMNEDKQKIEDLYIKIGKEVYENHIREEKVDIVSKVEELAKEIDVYADEIELTRVELLRLRDLKQCKKCSYEMEIDYKFCPSCGAKQKEELNQEDDNEEVTTNLGKDDFNNEDE